jgi:hypothetical protein
MADRPILHDVDPDAPPTADELTESARLREALDDPSKPHEGADLLRSLAAASAPREIDPATHRGIVARAVATKRGVVIRVAFGATTLLAVAAALLLYLRRGPEASRTTPAAAAQVAVTRSTQPLFSEPFASEGGERERVDRIAMARASDLRQNRFAKWGVR